MNKIVYLQAYQDRKREAVAEKWAQQLVDRMLKTPPIFISTKQRGLGYSLDRFFESYGEEGLSFVESCFNKKASEIGLDERSRDFYTEFYHTIYQDSQGPAPA